MPLYNSLLSEKISCDQRTVTKESPKPKVCKPCQDTVFGGKKKEKHTSRGEV